MSKSNEKIVRKPVKNEGKYSERGPPPTTGEGNHVEKRKETKSDRGVQNKGHKNQTT